ncbi:hypothetical protein [Komarekiella delphini-convector]|uniref:hypothetical protein n=1 Tax=Komarekiella delphini-convector TaxID=3050158 RepID=UPI001CD8D4A1|nr:hypothetical protein [Komarekiella delphini-convector]
MKLSDFWYSELICTTSKNASSISAKRYVGDWQLGISDRILVYTRVEIQKTLLVSSQLSVFFDY